MPEAFITLATTDEYCMGAINLAMSLKRTGTKRDIVIMITESVTGDMRAVLSSVFSKVVLVDVLDSRDHANLALLERPDLGVTFTKLHCWRLAEYSRAVFMDADTMVLQNIDDLFQREELSAAPDPGWPDCFNSGVFVFQPSHQTYEKLLQFAMEIGSFDGGDQGLLNLFFSDWAIKDIARHLPFVYNCVSQAFYSYAPAFAHFRRNVKVVHFVGPTKPWHFTFDPASGQLSHQGGSQQTDNFSQHSPEFLQKWWALFISETKPLLSASMGGLCGQIANLDTTSFKLMFEDDEFGASGFRPQSHQQAWEYGIIDYRGLDKFENIRSHLDNKLSGKQPQQTTQPQQQEPPHKHQHQ